MLDFITTVTFFAVLGIISYGFFNWIQKIELEKEYLETLLLDNLLEKQKEKNGKASR